MSLTTKDILDSLREGDIVRVTQTVKITGRNGDRVYFEDVKYPTEGFYLDGDDTKGTTKINVVMKAAPPKPVRPKVGDVLTFREFAKHQWKRGTVIQFWPDADGKRAVGSTWILRPSGKWQAINTPKCREDWFCIKSPDRSGAVDFPIVIHYAPR